MTPSIRIARPNDPKSHEITDRALWLRRREFLAGAAALGGAAFFGGCSPDGSTDAANAAEAPPADAPTPKKDATRYNNFYEFGTDKTDPAENAHTLRTRPWTIAVEGECAKPGSISIEDVLAAFPRQERVYRLRCVEAWSMVIPWLGFPLGELIKRVEPTGNAKYVEMVTLLDPKQMPGQKRAVLKWPYVEALRLDEAMHPLTLMAVGVYGKMLPNQMGAPLRLVVPWKYGFKNVKSIVKIRLTAEQPKNTWAVAAPTEYGFYANVNPAVDHPRWSQATERRIGELGRRKTLPFNGYADEVAGLYSNLDLRKNF